MNFFDILKRKRFADFPMMTFTDVYLGIGGNIGDTHAVLLQTIEYLKQLPCVFNVQTSRFYVTTPVGYLNQNPFINAACYLQTTLKAEELFLELQKIEVHLGKTEKPKNYPRIIDIDLLFFGTEIHESLHLKIPHPRWQERLFVLIPLADLTSEVLISTLSGEFQKINLIDFLEHFSNDHYEKVFPLEEASKQQLRDRSALLTQIPDFEWEMSGSEIERSTQSTNLTKINVTTSSLDQVFVI